MIFLDSLGPEADVDFAKQLLQAHDWDLQAALETVTGGTVGPSQPHEEVDVRAPLRTGYVDRLIDTSHEEEQAVLASSESAAIEASARQDLQDALWASEQEFLRQADIQEQAALAAAMEASRISQPAEVGMPGLPRSPHSAATGKAVSLGNEVAATHLSSHRRAARSYPEQGSLRSSPARASPVGVPDGWVNTAESPSASSVGNGAARLLPQEVRPFPAVSGEKVQEPAVSQTSHVNAFADEARPPRQPARRPNTEKTVEKEKPRKAPKVEDASGRPKAQPASKVGVQRPILSSSGAESASRNIAHVGAPRHTLSSSSVSSSAAGMSNRPPKAGSQRHAFNPDSALGVSESKVPIKAPRPALSSLSSLGSSTTSGVAAVGSPALLYGNQAGSRQASSTATATKAQRRSLGAAPAPTALPAPQVEMCKARAPQASSVARSTTSSQAETEKAAAPVAPQAPAAPQAPSAEAAAAAERFEAREAEELRREREEAEFKRKEAEASGERESDALVTALQALRRLHLKRDPSELATCLQTLRAYISNLAKHPQEPKYQSINCENNNFRSKVASVEGAIAVLEACGFVADGTKLLVDAEFLKTKGRKLWDALSKVDLILEQVKQSA